WGAGARGLTGSLSLLYHLDQFSVESGPFGAEGGELDDVGSSQLRRGEDGRGGQLLPGRLRGRVALGRVEASKRPCSSPSGAALSRAPPGSAAADRVLLLLTAPAVPPLIGGSPESGLVRQPAGRRSPCRRS